MKEFSQYSSAEEFIQDLITDGVFPRNRKVQAMFPGLKTKPNKNHLERLKLAIVDRLKDSAARDVFHREASLTNLRRRVRGDNYPEVFSQAIQELIAEQKITEQKLWGKKGRPTTYYNLFEF